MDILTLLISRVNDVLWTYILIIMLLGCAFWFTFKTNFVQFRMIREMIRLLGDSTGKTEGREHHISSFQAFAVSIASRVGTGNLDGGKVTEQHLDRHYFGWSGCSFLDVGNCSFGGQQRFY